MVRVDVKEFVVFCVIVMYCETCDQSNLIAKRNDISIHSTIVESRYGVFVLMLLFLNNTQYPSLMVLYYVRDIMFCM